MHSRESVNDLISQLYRQHSGKVLAYLTSLTDDLAAAEEIWQDSLAQGIVHWQQDMPDNPTAWLFRVARNGAIDHLRHQQLSLKKSRILQALAQGEGTVKTWHDTTFGDEQLKLIFTCCHPALSDDRQIALTLNTICGLTANQIAQALVLPKATMEQRLARAKQKLRDAGIPFSIPEHTQLDSRLQTVQKTLYLMFNADECDSAQSNQPDCARIDLAREAIRVCAQLNRLLPHNPEIEGLQALMMFHLARRPARYDRHGQIVLLAEQDRSQWDKVLIAKADELLKQAFGRRQPGSYQLQAAIQGVHCLSPGADATDWRQIEALYHLLMAVDNNPVITINAAVAISMARGAQAGLDMLKNCEDNRQLQRYPLLHATRGHLLTELGRSAQAIEAYQKALALTESGAQAQFYQDKLAGLHREHPNN